MDLFIGCSTASGSKDSNMLICHVFSSAAQLMILRLGTLEFSDPRV